VPSVVAQRVFHWIRAFVAHTGNAKTLCRWGAWVPRNPGRMVLFARMALVRFSVWLSLFLP